MVVQDLINCGRKLLSYRESFIFVDFSSTFSFLAYIFVYRNRSKILLIEKIMKWYESTKLEYYRYQIKYLGLESIKKDINLAQANAGRSQPHTTESSNNQYTTSTTKNIPSFKPLKSCVYFILNSGYKDFSYPITSVIMPCNSWYLTSNVLIISVLILK